MTKAPPIQPGRVLPRRSGWLREIFELGIFSRRSWQTHIIGGWLYRASLSHGLLKSAAQNENEAFFHFDKKYCLIVIKFMLKLLNSGVETVPKSKQDRNRRGETECWKHNCSLLFRSRQYQGAKMGKKKV